MKGCDEFVIKNVMPCSANPFAGTDMNLKINLFILEIVIFMSRISNNCERTIIGKSYRKSSKEIERLPYKVMQVCSPNKEF